MQNQLRMSIQSELCHIDSNRVIVKVNAFEGEILIGSTLGEGKTAEEAEDRGITRLIKRLDSKFNQRKETQTETKNKLPKSNPIISRVSPSITSNNKTFPIEPNEQTQVEKIDQNIPIDWSKELAQIDLELERIGWKRDEENKFLEQSLRISNRHKITDYKTLEIYLEKLKKIPNNLNKEKNANILNRDSLLKQCNEYILRLKWEPTKAKEYLYQKMNVTSRSALNNEKLLEFNMLLESIIKSNIE